MTQLNIQDLINKANALVTNPAPATEVDPASNEGMFAMMANLPQEPTVYGKPAQEKDFSVNAFNITEVIPADIAPAFVARSSSGYVNVNGKEKTKASIVISDRETQYMTPKKFIDKVVRTQVVGDDVGEFLTIKRREIEVYFQEGGAPMQDIGNNSVESPSFDLTGSIEPDSIMIAGETKDLSYYKGNAALLEVEKTKFVTNSSNDIMRKKMKNILFSKSLQADNGFVMNEDPTTQMITKKMYAPILAQNGSTDATHHNIQYVEVNGAANQFRSPLFSLKDHYNNPSMHGFGVRFNTKITLENWNAAGKYATMSDMEMIENLLMQFSSESHIERGSGRRGMLGSLPNVKPIFVPKPKFASYFKYQTTEKDSYVFSDNYARLSQYVDIMVDPYLLNTRSDATVGAGEIIGLLIYPQTYHVYQFTQDNELLYKYNRDVQKISGSGGIMEYRAEYNKPKIRDKNAHGTITLVGEMTECGFLSNPFACLTIRSAV